MGRVIIIAFDLVWKIINGTFDGTSECAIFGLIPCWTCLFQCLNRQRHPARTNGWGTFYARCFMPIFAHFLLTIRFSNRMLSVLDVARLGWLLIFHRVLFVIIVDADDLNFMHTENPFGSSLALLFVAFHTNNSKDRRRRSRRKKTKSTKQRNKDSDINSQSCIRQNSKCEFQLLEKLEFVEKCTE